MERAFNDVNIGGPLIDEPFVAESELTKTGLLIAFFQQREYFDHEAARYASVAAKGHTVIVAFTGDVDSVPDGVTAVSLSPDDAHADDWVLTMVRGAFAATLTARDLHELSPGEATLETSRLFTSWTTVRRHLALEDGRMHLESLASQLPPDVLARARAQIDASIALPVSDVEDRLAGAADYLLRAVDAGYQRAAGLRRELELAKSLAERDQLTGLHNRHYLERFLGRGEHPADLLALLVDVDGLKSINDGHGHEAGDAVLRCVAETLRTNTRPGDVLVRWGGDEFLLLVPRLNAVAGLSFGERLAQAIAAARVDDPWSHLQPSASIGVSPASRTPVSMAQLDAALHHVKHNRKGHAALAPSLP